MLLLLSNSEAYGIVVAEAVALGTPCIVADATALHEFVAELGFFGVAYPLDPEKAARLSTQDFESTAQVGPFSGKIRTGGVGRAYERLTVGASRAIREGGPSVAEALVVGSEHSVVTTC